VGGVECGSFTSFDDREEQQQGQKQILRFAQNDKQKDKNDKQKGIRAEADSSLRSE
jgi:hypothetical protein